MSGWLVVRDGVLRHNHGLVTPNYVSGQILHIRCEDLFRKNNRNWNYSKNKCSGDYLDMEVGVIIPEREQYL